MINVQTSLCQGSPNLETGCMAANAKTLYGAKTAVPEVPEESLFSLLLQEAGIEMAEETASLCLPALSAGETLPGGQFIVDSGEKTEARGQFAAESVALPVSGVMSDAGHTIHAAGIPAAAPLHLSGVAVPDTGQSPPPPSAGMPAETVALPVTASSRDAVYPPLSVSDEVMQERPFQPADTLKSESGPQQKTTLPDENSGRGNLKSEFSGLNTPFPAAAIKAPAAEISGPFTQLPQYGESSQHHFVQAVPERPGAAPVSASSGMPQQDLSWLSGSSALQQPDGVMDQVLVKMQHLVRAGTEELQIKLYPESLGEMKVKVSSEQGLFTAEITVAHAGVKELLEWHLDQLRQRFKQLNLPVDLINVLVEQGGQEGFPPQGENERRDFSHRDALILLENAGGESSRSSAAQQLPAPGYAGRSGINVLV